MLGVSLAFFGPSLALLKQGPVQRHGGFESQQLGAPWPLFGSVCPSMAGCLVVGKWVSILGVLLVFFCFV